MIGPDDEVAPSQEKSIAFICPSKCSYLFICRILIALRRDKSGTRVSNDLYIASLNLREVRTAPASIIFASAVTVSLLALLQNCV